MSQFCYPIICKLTTRSVLGPEFNNNTKLHETFIEYNKTAEYLMGVALIVPSIFHGFFTKPARKQDELVKEYVAPIIKKRRQSLNTPPIDLLQKLIDSGLDDEAILGSIKTIMWASVMNTSSLVMHLLYDIFSSPKITQNMEEEQSRIRQKELTYDSLDEMVYLDACIKETLRIASAPFGAVREVFQDIPYSQGTIPQNTIVMISRYLVHHDEKTWKNAEIYDPERFVNKSVKNWTFIPFGGGRHICPGRFYATFVVKLVISELMRNYDIKVPGKRPALIVNGNEVRSVKEPIVFTKKVITK